MKGFKNNSYKYISTLIILSTVLLSVMFLYSGIIHINNPNKNKYPIRGVDVSSYQGDINWEKISSNDISFAFIKATEGSAFIDTNFKTNWINALKTKLVIGAYHFFSFESSGETQADLFYNTVKNNTKINISGKMLPPVIDVEYYGKFKSEKDIDIKKIKSELRKAINKTTRNFGVKPILYVTEKSFNTIVQKDFSDCDLWYRSVYYGVPKNIEWKFWQFSNRHRLKGYKGKEKFIDMNVFCGSAEEFEKYKSDIVF